MSIARFEQLQIKDAIPISYLRLAAAGGKRHIISIAASITPFGFANKLAGATPRHQR